jgi:hypothetical protein
VSDAGWRVAYNSVAGTSHEKTELPCQDVGSCRIIADPSGRPILLAIACDGAGSASRSLDGANLTVERFLEEFSESTNRAGLGQITREAVEDWLSRLRAEIKDLADAEDLSTRDFACTVLAAIIGEEQAAFFQIGDGAIVVSNRSEPDDYGWVFWPQHGEFANQTNFITQDDALDALVFELEDRCIDEVAIFTDGIERLVLDLTEQTAHAPFFRTLFGWLVKEDLNELNTKITTSPVIERYLGSKQVNDRTDDDKTLILATRRQISPTEPAVVDADPSATGAA